MSDETPEVYASPLRIMLSEMHEVHVELMQVGFSERNALVIVAHMIQDAMLYRASDEDEDDENDEEDDFDDDESGLI